METPESGASDVIASWLVMKAKKDPKVAKLIENVHMFDELKAHPAWIKLLELTERQKDGFLDSIVRRLWLTPSKPPTPQEIEYHKGFYMGAIWVLKHPEMAEASLESAARAAWLMSQGEIDDAEEAAS